MTTYDTEKIFVFGLPIRTKTFASGSYWESRYKDSGTSGSGSYGRLALFKAKVINALADEMRIESVIEFGSGDGNQLSLFTIRDYVGFDVSETALRLLRKRFAGDSTKKFLHVYEYAGQRAHMSMSLDVIFHLVEDTVFMKYMERLFETAERYVVIYASNYDERATAHVRHRCFTDWVEQHQPLWKLIRHIPNIYPFDEKSQEDTSFANFYIYLRTE